MSDKIIETIQAAFDECVTAREQIGCALNSLREDIEKVVIHAYVEGYNRAKKLSKSAD